MCRLLGIIQQVRKQSRHLFIVQLVVQLMTSSGLLLLLAAADRWMRWIWA
jgi:hypothetical protein